VRFEAFLLTDFDGGTTVMDLGFTVFLCIKILAEILSFLSILLRRESLADLWVYPARTAKEERN
jgi:hypothetical protein